ncbi:hypothetical protein AMTR_s00096p00156650 [Amborella trichopoda]|uniref:Uncharacterized protein n=1 Tax=Amborella trichopoda TaxID=13333 RepID=W1P3E2_AMBTC|nr:hypothetical protein AMTR_s00096p00156650 [Amborella trichopoda]
MFTGRYDKAIFMQGPVGNGCRERTRGIPGNQGLPFALVKGTDMLPRCCAHSAWQPKRRSLQRRMCDGDTCEGDNSMPRMTLRGARQQATFIDVKCATSNRVW